MCIVSIMNLLNFKFYLLSGTTKSSQASKNYYQASHHCCDVGPSARQDGCDAQGHRSERPFGSQSESISAKPHWSDNEIAMGKRLAQRFYPARWHAFSKLLSEMEFGLWKYMFANVQYRLSGRILLRIFPNKPKSSQSLRFDNTYVFGELDYINNLRNRIAHHEPICFGNPVCIDTFYAKNRYNRIMELFRWMDIDGASLLYGLGHISNACEQIDKLLQ